MQTKWVVLPTTAHSALHPQANQQGLWPILPRQTDCDTASCNLNSHQRLGRRIHCRRNLCSRCAVVATASTSTSARNCPTREKYQLGWLERNTNTNEHFLTVNPCCLVKRHITTCAIHSVNMTIASNVLCAWNRRPKPSFCNSISNYCSTSKRRATSARYSEAG